MGIAPSKSPSSSPARCPPMPAPSPEPKPKKRPVFYLMLDVETTSENTPHMVSLEAEVHDETFCLVLEMSSVVKPRRGYATLTHAQDVRYHGGDNGRPRGRCGRGAGQSPENGQAGHGPHEVVHFGDSGVVAVGGVHAQESGHDEKVALQAGCRLVSIGVAVTETGTTHEHTKVHTPTNKIVKEINHQQQGKPRQRWKDKWYCCCRNFLFVALTLFYLYK